MKIGLDEVNWLMENKAEIHPEHCFEDQTDQLLEYLGSPDSHIRESSLVILCRWIERGTYETDQLLEMAGKLKNNILEGLGDKETDSVFLRAFAALVLGDIIGFDEECALGNIEGKDPFLTRELIMEYFEASLKYYAGEKDIRGYVDVKEWAHSIAHGADLLKKFALNRLIGKEEFLRILEVFRLKIVEPQENVYKAREELRITIAIYSLFLRRILDTDEIIDWFESFEEYIVDKYWPNYVKEPKRLIGLLNLRAFLNCMFFMMKNGIANTGFYGIPFYQNNILEGHDTIAETIESLILQMDKNNYFIE